MCVCSMHVFIYKHEHVHFHVIFFFFFFLVFGEQVAGEMLLQPLILQCIFMCPQILFSSHPHPSLCSIIGKQFHSYLSFLYFFLLKMNLCMFNFSIFLMQKGTRIYLSWPSPQTICPRNYTKQFMQIFLFFIAAELFKYNGLFYHFTVFGYLSSFSIYNYINISSMLTLLIFSYV